MVGSTRSETEEEPELVLVKKLVTQERTQTFDSARTDFNDAEGGTADHTEAPGRRT